MDTTILLEATTCRVSKDDECVALRPRELEILLLLATRPNGIDAFSAVESLYGGVRASRGMTNLKVNIHRLRSRIGFDAVIFAGGKYRLGPRVTVDATELRSIVSNLTARLGDLAETERTLLETVALHLRGSGSERFLVHDWYARFCENLAQTGADVLGLLAWQAIDRSEFEEALRLVRATLEADPCDERALEIAIHAYAGLGRPGNAIADYKRYTKRLHDELGIGPSSELAAVFRAAVMRVEQPQPAPHDNGRLAMPRVAEPSRVADHGVRDRAGAI